MERACRELTRKVAGPPCHSMCTRLEGEVNVLATLCERLMLRQRLICFEHRLEFLYTVDWKSLAILSASMTVVEAAVEKVQDVAGAGDSKPVREFPPVLLQLPTPLPARVLQTKTKKISDGPLVL